MKGLGRYHFDEITLERIFLALQSRVREIPHSLMWNLDPSAKINKAQIEKYKDIHKGKRCFIIANGPSLQKTNLELISQEFSFGLNRIYLNFDKSSFRPTYLVVVNELIIEQCSNEIKEVALPKFLNWNRRGYFIKADSGLVYLKSKMVFQDHFEYDLTHPMVFGATVTFATLQLAYYMGFSQVILIGLDHNYKEKGVPSKVETRVAEKDESHFDSQYFPKGFKWQLPDLLRSEIEYVLAKEAFEKDGREILDATIDGKCQIFKKVDYLSLFK
jgi:hypothetical protein